MERTVNSPISPDRFRRVSHPPVQTEVSYDRSALSRVWAALRENRLAMVCLVLMAIIIAASILAPLSPYDPDQYDLMNKLALPSLAHPFGTDDLGRDYFTRALYGGRVSLTVGFFSMLVSVALGTVVGTVSGYVGGAVDMLLMRFLDIIMSVPTFLLIIIINAYVKPGLPTMIFIIAIFSWMGVARIVRAETMSLKERDFVLAAKNLGASDFVIIFRHIIPNMSSSIIVAASLSIARAILTESSLSFLGFGVRLPNSSWGSMLQNAQSQILYNPLLAVFPGLLILITVLSFNVLGDVLRSALEPRILK